ncbi:MAG: UbiH/UbiF/VisC/COQ6 family ubiquinone biosynthesis hydroxylase [Pseudomonadota bacterium]
MSELDADVIVIGAGISGSTCACLLAKAGISVILLEASARQIADLKPKDPRIFAISPASRCLLEQAGAWRRIIKEDLGHYRAMHVWDENGLGEICFDSAEICQSTMGYIIPYALIADVLQDVMLDMENIRCLWSVKPKSISHNNDSVTITTEDNLNYSAKLVVAADGSQSIVRKLAGIQFKKHDYKQSALGCTVITEKPHEQIARQRFLSNGPLAFLPMAKQNESAIVWSGKPDQVKTLIDMEEGAFFRELANAFDFELGQITACTERKSFPLYRAEASHYTDKRLVLVGDSAHVIHPLAGLGANLGLLDVATLVDIIQSAVDRKRDIGRQQVLRSYERWRKGENRNMLYLMDGFKYLFENQQAPVKWVRNAGLDMVDAMPLVKNVIMKYAMGLQGNLPKRLQRQVY